MIWWVFLYAFVVFPWQYVSLNLEAYRRNYSSLYMLESGVLMLMLGLAARGAPAGWKKVYLNLMTASGLYAFYGAGFLGVTLTLTQGAYYSGSLYDIPLIGSVSWMAATSLTARQWKPEAVPAKADDTWGAMTLRLAMLAILSLPALGLWVYRWDDFTGSGADFPPFYRVGSHAGAGRLRFCAPVSAGSGAHPFAGGFAS